MRIPKCPRWVVVALMSATVVALTLSDNAQAAGTVLDSVDAAFKPHQSQWSGALRGYAVALFFMLVTIDFMWSSTKQVLDHGLTQEALVAGLGQRIIRYGFFFALLKFSDSWLPALIDSFRQLGAKAGGVTSATPDAIVDKGVDVAVGVFQLLTDVGLAEALVLALPMMVWALIIFVCFCFVAMQILITNIEIYLVCGAGVILLGLGGSAWTKDMAVNVYKYALQVGMKLMILLLIVGVGQTVMDSMTIDRNDLLRSALAMGGAVLTYAYLAIKAPALANGMISGSSSLSAGDLLGAAIGIGAGTAAAGAGVAAAGAMGGQAATKAAGVGSSALAGAAGLAQAASAGFESAMDFGKTGMTAATHAASEVASHGLGLGRAAVAGAAADATAGFKDKVAGSAGAKIAQSIEASRGGSIGQAGGNGSAAGGDKGAASGGGSATSATTTAGGQQSFMESLGVPAPAASPSDAGNAAGASLERATAGGPAATSSQADKSSGGYGPSLHDRISSMDNFVPDDNAQAAHVAIDTNAQAK